MSGPAYMAFYPADYLAATGHLTPAQHGAYCLLIFHYWVKGGLPREDKFLARICRMSEREWKANRDTIAEFFTADWKHERIEKEMERAALKSEARATSGARGGQAKALKERESKLANATVLPQQTPSESLASSSEPESEKKEERPTVSCASEPDELALALNAYNASARLAGWPIATKLTDKRKSSLRLRIADAGGLPGWTNAMSRARASPFLCGDNNHGWKADLDFFLQSSRFTKLLEGSYDRQRSGSPSLFGDTHPRPSREDPILSAARRRIAELQEPGRDGVSFGDEDNRNPPRDASPGSGGYRLLLS